MTHPPGDTSPPFSVRARLITAHKPDCDALEAVRRGVWTTPWTLCRTEYEFRDYWGSRRHHTRGWLTVQCNSPQCPASAIVVARPIEEAIHIALTRLEREVRA